MGRRSRIGALLISTVALLASAACRGPESIESTVEFQTEHGVVRGVSTEDGVFTLVEAVPVTGEVGFRCRTGHGFFDDVALLVRRNDSLAVLAPKSSRPNLARFAGYPAGRDERLYLEVRTADHGDLLACHLHDGGRMGDLLVLDEGTIEFDDVVRQYAGTGVFAWRDGTMQLVGILNGVWCDDPHALAFVGLDEMSTLLPASSEYFARKVLPRRADFEYGVPRSFEGERPEAADTRTTREPGEVDKTAAPAPPPNEAKRHD
jgi:hypothetical protein